MAQQQKLDKTERYSLGSPQLLIGDPTVADGKGMTDYGQIPEAVITVTPNVYSASDVGGHQQAGATYGKGVDISVDLTLYDFQEAGVATFIEGASQPTEEFEITSIDDSNDEIEVDDTNDDLSSMLEAGDMVLLPDDLTNSGPFFVEGEVTHSSGTTTIPVESSLQSETLSGSPMLTFFYDMLTFGTNTRKLALPTVCLIPSENRNAGSIIDQSNWWIPAAVNTSDVAFSYVEGDGEDANESYEPSLMSHLRKYDQSGMLLPQQIRKGMKAAPSVIDSGLGWSLPSSLRDNP